MSETRKPSIFDKLKAGASSLAHGVSVESEKAKLRAELTYIKSQISGLKQSFGLKGGLNHYEVLNELNLYLHFSFQVTICLIMVILKIIKIYS